MNSSNGNPTNGSSIADSDYQESRIRILVVDDQKMIREGLKALIKTEMDLEVVDTAENGEDAIKKVEALQPDIVLMDMEMPGMGGMSATRAICQKFKEVRVLVLSTYDRQEYVSRSLGAGAMGYLLKGTPAKELTDAIRSVHRGYAQIGPGAYQKLPLDPNIQEPQTPPSPASVLSKTKPTTPQVKSEEEGSLISKNSDEKSLAVKNKSSLPQRKFEQTVILRQSPKWSRAIIWAVMGVTTFAVLWSAVAKIELVVPTRGQLKPIGSVKEIQVPSNGVVKEVFVEDGDKVKEGQLLFTLDSAASKAELESSQEILQSLSQENKLYQALMDNSISSNNLDEMITKLDIPREVALLSRNRTELVEENQLFRAQLGLPPEGTLNPEQMSRLKAAQQELKSRTAAARLEVEQLEKQLNQNQIQLEDTRKQLATAREVLTEIKQRNDEYIAQAEASLEIDRALVDSIQPLVEEGALSEFQLKSQQQQLNDRYERIVERRASGSIEYDRQQQEIKSLLAEINRLLEEQKRLSLDVAQAREQLINTTSLSEKNIRDQIAQNKKNIAQIDSQLNKTIVENNKRIAETRSQISRAEQNLRYQEFRSPTDGTVFDLKAFPGYVPPTGQAASTQPVLQIVPNNYVIAEVFIPAKDIGFVENGMVVDVRIDTFDFSQFGDIKGKVVSIASDALEPDQNYQFFRFPTKIELEQQYINIRGKDIPLQSGMSISANIRIREDRTVLSLFTGRLSRGADNFKKLE
ncbi:MAG: response regulator [Xenococcaceae cyanobacterium MO_188.B29]|nr:response regulator [Xenococcaceae cyanobacterium MO_188.B29]